MSGLLVLLMLLAVSTSGSASAAQDENDVREKLRSGGVWLTPEESLQQKAELDSILDSLDNAANMLESLPAPPLQVQINGSQVNVPPHMSVYMSVYEGQVMVPLSWMAGQLEATSVEWDAATRTATITSPQDFYSMEKFSAYARGIKSPIEELNDQICPLPDKVKDMGLPELLPDRHFVLELEQFKPEREGLTLPAPRDYITIEITSPDGTYEHSSVVHSIENHQDHYYLPMDWLEYLFNAKVNHDGAANILSVQAPDLERIKTEIERIENALIPDSADEAIKLWGRGEQTRNGSLQYIALSPQLRQEADKSAYVRQSYWVTGSSSPQVGPITIASRNQLSDTKIEYTLSFPEVFSGQTYAIATEKMVVEKLFDNGQEGWFVTQILQSSGYGIIKGPLDRDSSDETVPIGLSDEELNGLRVIQDYFNAFAEADYETMRTMATNSHNENLVHDGDVWGMKWARAKQIEIVRNPLFLGTEDLTAVMAFNVSVDMETVERSAQYPSTQTTFYVVLIKGEDGSWRIASYTTG